MNMGTKSKACLIISIFLLGMICVTAAGRTIYVDDDGPADFNTIQAAIDDSNDGDTIIVADGVYTGEGNRDIEFGESYGWPPGPTKAITVRSENGPENCIIDCNGAASDPHRGFRFICGEDANSIINGFTITNGFAQCEELYPPPIDGCTDQGGAIYCGWYSSPTISNCIISGNRSSMWGGGIACHYESSPTVSNCIFIGNWAYNGGGIWNNVGEMTVTNCILWGNMPDQIIDYDYPLSNTTVMFSDVQDGWTGLGNIDADPCFSDPCNGDYHLKSQAGRWDANSESWVQDAVTSPCIDAGNPGCPLGDEPAPNGNRRNMGAYGGIAEASKSPANWRSIADMNNDRILDYNDLKVFAGYWLETGECIPSDLNRSQSADFADFALLANNWHRSRTGKSVFDFGVATKGPLHMAGNIELEGVNISIESDVYIVSENSNLALEIIGNSSITGDVFITNPDATVDLQGDLFSIGGETGEAALDHVHTGVDPIAFPVPNPSYFEPYVVGDINLADTTFTNVRIPPNTNPIFGGGVTMYGVIFVETPNVVTFSGNVNITGIIVGDGDLTDDSETNRIDFMDTVNSASVSSLPAEFGDLREETGTFLMAPGFSLSFGGNFGTINGVIAANGIEFHGNAGGTIEGSVLNYSDTPMELSGNSDLYFNRFADIEMPAGFE